MKNKDVRRYQIFLGLELAVVMLVILIFRSITDRMTAGTVAGALFLLSTLTVMTWEWRTCRRVTWALAGSLIFFLGGVVPILLLRYLSWGEVFETAELAGITGAQWHRTSNFLYSVFLVGIFISLQLSRRVKK